LPEQVYPTERFVLPVFSSKNPLVGTVKVVQHAACPGVACDVLLPFPYMLDALLLLSMIHALHEELTYPLPKLMAVPLPPVCSEREVTELIVILVSPNENEGAPVITLKV
jgi:hypothetical protein